MNTIPTIYPDAVLQVRAFLAASIKKDKPFMLAHLHDAFLFTTPRGTLFNLTSFLSDFLANPKFTIEIFELPEHTVFDGDGFSIVNGVSRIRFSGQEEQYERMTFVLTKDEEKWKFLHIQGTFTTPPQAG